MKIRLWFSGLILALFGTAAQAETQGNTWYIGSGAGLYYVDLDSVGFDQSAPTVRLFGGYKWNEYLSFEAGYSNLFKVSDDVLGIDVEMKGSSLDATVRPTWPISDRFEAFGILGVSRYDWKVTLDDGLITVSDDDKSTELMFGLGGAWHFNDAWSLRGEWAMVDVSDADFGIFSASVSYNFQ